MKLIAGPGVYVCNECVDLCNEILEEEVFQNAGSSARTARSITPSGPTPGSEVPHPLATIDGKQIETAVQALSNVIGVYETSMKTKLAEPFYRAQLTLLEFQHGSKGRELMPTLQRLRDIYLLSADYESLANVLEWMISIAEDKDHNVEEKTALLVNLAGFYVEMADRSNAQKTLKRIAELLESKS